MTSFVAEFLSNESFWFANNRQCDEYLTNKYEHTLDIEISTDLTNDECLALVVLFDQLPRHVFRGTSSNHIIEYFLQKSLMMFDRVDTSELEDDVLFAFAHLPLRHTGDPRWIHCASKALWGRVKPGCDNFVQRFLKASYERCPTNDQSQFIRTVYEDVIFDPSKHSGTTFFTPDDYALPLDRSDFVVKEVEKALVATKPREILMSISGGSDSMTLFHILSGLRNVYGFDIKVAMINYMNRGCSVAEEEFVADFVNWSGLPLTVRRIEEIQRKPCIDIGIRRTYESYTRDVRYGTYKTVMKNALVAMGHNKDDVLENVFQNIATQTKYDNLAGMDLVVEQDGILFFRPLLNVTKDQIVDYAKRNNIPFLPNSTPPHFIRGMIRNNLVPCVNGWNKDFIPGLFKLKDSMTELMNVMDIAVNKFVDDYNKGAVDASILTMGKIFLKTFFNKLFPSEHISAKSLDEFIASLSRFTGVKKFQLNVNVQLKIVRKKDKVLLTFK